MNEIKVITTNPHRGIYFNEETIQSGNIPKTTECGIINIYDDVIRQEILGFGGAFTEAAAYNYSLMDKETKAQFMKAYFDKKDGIGYNFGRTHINSCDFAIDIYSYVKDGDKALETFDISRDRKYIIPFIKDAMMYTNDDIFLFASPWSPPAYMKDNNDVCKGGILLDEYKELWALYYTKYIKAYMAEGIKISAITVQNEPNAIQTWESCEYTADDEREFIEKYLIPVFDKEGLSDIKIMIWDHNKERVYDRARNILVSPKVNERVWAVAHHWYSGEHFEGPALVYEELHKPTICSEFCLSISESETNGISAAEKYGTEICENLNNYNIAICDWNLMLSTHGGPYHNRTDESSTNSIEDKGNGCYAPILFDQKNNKMILTPTYYYIGHFSKFIKKGAKRIGYTKYTSELKVCAFLNPDGTRVSTIINTSNEEKNIIIRNNDICTCKDIQPHSIMTVIF